MNLKISFEKESDFASVATDSVNRGVYSVRPTARQDIRPRFEAPASSLVLEDRCHDVVRYRLIRE